MEAMRGIAAGATDEAFAALLTPASVRAWRRHEGDMRGMRAEASALRERALRTLMREWGGPGVGDALAHLALAREAERLLEGLDHGISHSLRAALVAHGLRSVESALRAVQVSGAVGYNLLDSIRSLLPWVTERAVPVLLATATEKHWPRAEVVAWLHERGLTSLALGLLLDAPAGMGEPLAQLAPSLAPDDLTRAIGAVMTAPAPHLHLLTDRVALLPWLPPDAREALLARCRAWLDDRTPDRSLVDAEEAVRLAGRLMQERLGAGDEPGALAWLSLLELYLLPLERDGALPLFWTSLTDAGASLDAASPALASAFEAMVARLVARLDWMALHDWAPLLRWRPRADWSERAERSAEESGWQLSLDSPMPDSWRPRVEAAVLVDVRARIADGTIAGGHGLDDRALLDREPLIALLPAWRATLDQESERRHFASVVARQGGRAGDSRCRALLDELAEQGEPVWEIPGWEQIWTEPERRELLVRWLHAPPAWPGRLRAVQALARLARQLSEPGEETARDRVQEAIRGLCQGQPAWIDHLAEASSPDDHPVLVASVLARSEASPVEDELVGVMDDPSLREQVARHFLSQPWSEAPRGWPRHVFATLPAGERLAAEHLFVERLRGAGQDVPFDSHTPAWLWQERVDAWAASGRSWLDLVAQSDLPFGELVDWAGLRPRLLAAVHEALPDAPDESHLRAPVHPAWQTLARLMYGLSRDDVLRLAPALDRMAGALRDALGFRAWSGLTDPAERTALATDPAGQTAALADLLSACARPPGDNPVTRLRASLWRDAGLPVDEQLRRAVAAAGEPLSVIQLLAACSDIDRPALRLACARHLLEREPPSGRLLVLGVLHRRDPGAVRDVFHAEVQSAALDGDDAGLLDAMASELDDATLRAVLPRVFEPGREPLVRLVRRIGGPAAVEAWVRGVVAAHALAGGAEQGDAGAWTPWQGGVR